MPFQVRLQVVVSAEDHRDEVVLSRLFELPFTPFSGLALYGVMDNPEEQVYVESVAYDVTDEIFYCDLENDLFLPDPEREEEDGDELTFDEKLAEYGDEWELEEAEEDDKQS